MPSAGFEPATPATKRPQTYLDRSANGIGFYWCVMGVKEIRFGKDTIPAFASTKKYHYEVSLSCLRFKSGTLEI
jgi:hypothetical protein